MPMTTMKIFRAADAPSLAESSQDHEMSYVMTPDSQAGILQLIEAGIGDGTVVKSLFSAPGFSLVYAWFKPYFPLARHSHNTDCLYYVISGSLRLGTEELGAGDGFFLPKDVPYTYRIGADGLEILEFRHTSHFEFRAASSSQAYWDKAVATVKSNREAWMRLVPPRPAVDARGLAARAGQAPEEKPL
jgi:hypothetical protein